MTPTCLYDDLPEDLVEEVTEVLVRSSGVRIERIVSQGHSSPRGFWYDQAEAEWVVVLRGRARLVFEGDAEPVELGPGDHVHIPARRRHRVAWTTPDEPTIWLAIFHSEEGE